MCISKIFVQDNDNNISDTIIDSVVVLLGKSNVSPVFPDSVFIRDTNTFLVRGTDTNGTIKQWAVSWDTLLPFEVQSTVSLLTRILPTD